MTNRINALTVTLKADIREDDIQRLTDALYLITGVADVSLNVADMDSHVAQARVKSELRAKLFKALE